MNKLIPMAVATVCVATVAFASMNQPATATVVNNDHAIVDTLIPQTQENTTAEFPTTENNQAETPMSQDTTQPTQSEDNAEPAQEDVTAPAQEDTTAPAQAWPASEDNSFTDSSSVK